MKLHVNCEVGMPLDPHDKVAVGESLGSEGGCSAGDTVDGRIIFTNTSQVA